MFLWGAAGSESAIPNPSDAARSTKHTGDLLRRFKELRLDVRHEYQEQPAMTQPEADLRVSSIFLPMLHPRGCAVACFQPMPLGHMNSEVCQAASAFSQGLALPSSSWLFQSAHWQLPCKRGTAVHRAEDLSACRDSFSPSSHLGPENIESDASSSTQQSSCSGS